MFRNPPSLATILLIVNDDGRRSMLRQQLEALGYSVWPVTDQQPLAHLLQLGRCDLLVVDTDSSPNTPAVVAEISAVVAQGTPILRLASSTQFTPGWHEDSLGVRVANALRKRNADQLVSERLQRWQSMDVLDEELLLFRQAFIEAQLPGELERARRGYQPLTLVMMEVQTHRCRCRPTTGAASACTCWPACGRLTWPRATTRPACWCCCHSPSRSTLR